MVVNISKYVLLKDLYVEVERMQQCFFFHAIKERDMMNIWSLFIYLYVLFFFFPHRVYTKINKFDNLGLEQSIVRNKEGKKRAKSFCFPRRVYTNLVNLIRSMQKDNIGNKWI